MADHQSAITAVVVAVMAVMVPLAASGTSAALGVAPRPVVRRQPVVRTGLAIVPRGHPIPGIVGRIVARLHIAIMIGVSVTIIAMAIARDINAMRDNTLAAPSLSVVKETS